VGTLCGSGEAGDADAEGADARLSTACGLALHAEGKLLVADWGKNAIRDKGIGEGGAERLAGVLAQCPALPHLNLGYVTMAGAVSTV
jgi:hypothetical protein